jgi:hypothetical protein
MSEKITERTIETINLINEHGVGYAAAVQRIGRYAVYQRVKTLENSLGIKLYSNGQYDRMTYQGREWLKGQKNEQA